METKLTEISEADTLDMRIDIKLKLKYSQHIAVALE